MANQKDLANGLIGTALTSAATTLILQEGYGVSMPAVPFFLTITPAGQLSTRGNSEIVNVTARTGDTLTIERAQKGTAARAFSVGDIVSNSIYADGSFDSLDVAGDIYSNGLKVISGVPTKTRYLNGSGNLSSGTDETVIIRGWSYGTSTGGAIDVLVNFGVTFKYPPVVIASTLGYKDGSNPTSQTDSTGLSGEVARGGQQTTTTNTRVYIASSSGGGVANGTRVLFNLIIIGELA